MFTWGLKAMIGNDPLDSALKFDHYLLEKSMKSWMLQLSASRPKRQDLLCLETVWDTIF
jgi:hypothetical protein